MEDAIHGDRAIQHELVEYVFRDDLTAFEEGRDFTVKAPQSPLDISIANMIDTGLPSHGKPDRHVATFVPFAIDTGVPKSTGMVIDELQERQIDDAWHEQIASVWETEGKRRYDAGSVHNVY